MMSSSENVLISASVAAFLLVGPLQPARAQHSTFEAEYEISRSPTVVVLLYHRDIGMLAEPDPTPFLRLYGDGRYRVHYPPYMKRAGDWEGRISVMELNALVRSIIERRLLELDVQSVRDEIKAAELAARQKALRTGQAPQLFEVSDQESTRLRVRLRRYKPAGTLGVGGAALDKEIVWWGLRHDVRRHPQIRVLRELASLEDQLRALALAPGLERLEREEK